MDRKKPQLTIHTSKVNIVNLFHTFGSQPTWEGAKGSATAGAMWSLTICALHTQLTTDPHLEGPDTSAASSYLPGTIGTSPTTWEHFLYKATLITENLGMAVGNGWRLMTTVIVDYRSRWIIFTDEHVDDLAMFFGVAQGSTYFKLSQSAWASPGPLYFRTATESPI